MSLRKEIIDVCSEIYYSIAMDAFGISGATCKSEYVSVMGDHLDWAMTDDYSEYESSQQAREFYKALPHSERVALIESSFLG